MSQYKVPQNVQREDTIIGPLTLKQLIIVGIGGGIAYATYIGLARTYFIEVWLPPVSIITIITILFAFVKVHDLPFHIYLASLIEYKILPRKRIWIQGTGTPFISMLEKLNQTKQTKQTEEKQKSEKTIKELSTILDSHGESEMIKKKEELNKIIQQNYKK